MYYGITVMLLSQYETWKGDNEGMGQRMDQEALDQYFLCAFVVSVRDFKIIEK